MKRKPPFLFISLILTTILVTAVGIAGRKGVYARYNYNPKKDGPIVSLVMRGLTDDISPLAVLNPATDKTKETVSSKEDTSLKYFTSPTSEATDTGAQTGTTDTAATAASGSGASSSEAPPPAEPESTPSEEAPVNSDAGSTPEQQTPPDPAATPDPATAPADPAAGQTPVVPVSGGPGDDSYYADALFIGDSRTVGLSQYVPGLDAYATFYCKTSLNIFNALSAPMVQMEDGLQSAEVALSRKQFGKIYIMLGINEIGYGTDAFISTYAEVIGKIRALQPAATIYVQGIMHVSASKQAENPVFNNATVNERNGRLAALTNGADIIYMDINYLLDDEGGALNGAYTFDGVHLTADSYALWYQEIKEQTR